MTINDCRIFRVHSIEISKKDKFLGVEVEAEFRIDNPESLQFSFQEGEFRGGVGNYVNQKVGLGIQDLFTAGTSVICDCEIAADYNGDERKYLSTEPRTIKVKLNLLTGEILGLC